MYVFMHLYMCTYKNDMIWSLSSALEGLTDKSNAGELGLFSLKLTVVKVVPQELSILAFCIRVCYKEIQEHAGEES